MSSSIDVGAGMSEQRLDGRDEERPPFDVDGRAHEQPGLHGGGRTRLGRRLGAMTDLAVVKTMLVAWLASLAYATRWLVGSVPL